MIDFVFRFSYSSIRVNYCHCIDSCRNPRGQRDPRGRVRLEAWEAHAAAAEDEVAADSAAEEVRTLEKGRIMYSMLVEYSISRCDLKRQEALVEAEEAEVGSEAAAEADSVAAAGDVGAEADSEAAEDEAAADSRRDGRRFALQAKPFHSFYYIS